MAAQKLTFVMMSKRLSWIIFCLVVLTLSCQVQSQVDYCNITWLTRPGAFIQGGSYDASSYTVLQCRDSCLRFSNCIGFDFDGANRCWINFGGTLQRDPNNYITHYELYKGIHACNTTCTMSNGKALALVEYPNSHINGGSYTSDQTFSACVTRCADPATCRGFDWDPNNPNRLPCWIIGYSRNPIQSDSPGVYHYERECVYNGIYESTPNSIPYDQRTLPPNLSTVQRNNKLSTTIFLSSFLSDFYAVKLPDVTYVPADSVQGDPIHLQQTGIKPAYIVLIGLGGGCLLLTFIAVFMLCMYPFKDKDGGGYSRTTKTKTKKTTQTTTAARPASSHSQEQIGMSTVTTVHESRESYDRVSYEDNNRNTHISNGSAANDEYNRSNGGGSVRYSEPEARQSAGYHQDGDYGTSGGGSQSGGYHNEGYNTITSTASKKSGYTNEGYNSVNSKKSGYEYDRDSQADRGSTLERGHDRVESIAEENEEYNHSRNSKISGNPTYNQEDYY